MCVCFHKVGNTWSGVFAAHTWLFPSSPGPLPKPVTLPQPVVATQQRQPRQTTQPLLMWETETEGKYVKVLTGRKKVPGQMEAWIEGLKSKKRMNDENWATSLWDLIFFKVKPRPESQQRCELIHGNRARTSNIWGNHWWGHPISQTRNIYTITACWSKTG